MVYSHPNKKRKRLNNSAVILLQVLITIFFDYTLPSSSVRYLKLIKLKTLASLIHYINLANGWNSPKY
jgi:hypothetical protein